MTKVTLNVDMELWENYVAYSVLNRKTAQEMLNLHIAETVCLNQKKIKRFRKEMDELVNRINGEENQK